MTPLAVSTFAWFFIVIPLLAVWVFGLVDIWGRDLPRGAKAAWTLIVLVLPFVGTLVYFLMRKPTAAEIRSTGEASQDLHAEWRRGKTGGGPPFS